MPAGPVVPFKHATAGTNVKKGNQLLEQSGIKVITASNLDDAAKKAVAALS